MKANIRRWSSPSDDSFGYELVSPALLPGALALQVREAVTDVEGGAFILAHVASGDASGVVAAARATRALPGSRRLSLLVDAMILQEDWTRSMAGELSLVLDGVTIDTPLSAFVSESVEGIRFDDSFVRSASRDLRANAALRAMLGLANDMALVTFGMLVDDGVLNSGLNGMFHYVAPTVPTPRVKRGSRAFHANANDSVRAR